MSLTDSRDLALDDMDQGFDMTQAIAEAERCLLCFDAPCSKGCPAETDPGRFIRKLRLRNVTGAIKTIKHNNILGGACGVLCPATRLCQKECCSSGIGYPIQIGKLQRFLVEHAWNIGFDAFDARVFITPASRTERVAVVGAGPAGLACAAELAKAGVHVTVFEQRQEPGGVLRYGVPAFRLDAAFLGNEIETLRKLGIEFRCSTPIRTQGGVEDLLKDGFQAVFVGCGLWSAIPLRDDAQELVGVLPSVAFLSGLREGLSADAKRMLGGRKVAVIGGGSVAIDCARSAKRLGAGEVYLVYRRSYELMPAEEDERLEALQEGIHFLALNQPLDYSRDPENKLTGVKLVRTELSANDASGRKEAVAIPGSEWILPVDCVVEAIGNRAESESPNWYPSVKLGKDQRVQVDEASCQTSHPAIFAGGDIVRGPGLVVEAIADGKKAAKAILQLFKKGDRS